VEQVDFAEGGLEHLAGLKKLRLLDLSATAVTGSGLRHLKDCPDLIDFDLTRMRVTGEGLRGLAGWRYLRTLKLPRTTTDADLERLDGLESLDRLELTDSPGVLGPSLARLKIAAPNLPAGANENRAERQKRSRCSGADASSRALHQRDIDHGGILAGAETDDTPPEPRSAQALVHDV
jgi:hypothetical protein